MSENSLALFYTCIV